MALTTSSLLKILLCISVFQTALGSLGIPCGLGPNGFGYDVNAPNGPSNWPSLNPSFGTCNTGDMQSPINIPKSVQKDSSSLNPTLNFGKTELKFDCTNFNWELFCENPGSCGTTVFKGQTWNAISQKFHAPSEHTWDGTRFPLEAQTVHTNSQGELLIVATFFKAGKSNSVFENILMNIENGVEKFEVNLKKLLKGKKGFCTYDGSLTTPPCTEPVTWLINRQFRKIDTSQVTRFEATTGSSPFGNARPIQLLNDRTVTCFRR